MSNNSAEMKPMPFSTELTERAKAFAHAGHDSVGHVRKYSGKPYWVHVDEVAYYVASVYENEDTIAAAYQHDLAEDIFPVNPEYTFERIISEFGPDVAEIVHGLTDIYTKENHPHLNRKVRKQLEAERLGRLGNTRLGYAIHTVKLADLKSNTKSIVESDPGFARTYLREKQFLLQHLTRGHQGLLREAWETLEKHRGALMF